MSEPNQYILSKDLPFDGTTPITLPRNDLQSTQGRVYTGTIPGAGGVFAADFFHFSPESTKLVGVALDRDNPRSAAEIVAPSDQYSNRINLRRDFQYLLLHGQDRLRVVTQDTRSVLRLIVNQVSEAEHVAWAREQRPTYPHIRYRFIRTAPFLFNPNFAAWSPDWTWDPTPQVRAMNVTTDLNDGPIRIDSLTPWEDDFGCLVSIRYAGATPATCKFNVVHPENRAFWVAQSGIDNMRWSRVQYLRSDDMIGLEASSAAGTKIVCDIDMVRVEPNDRLLRRYSNSGGIIGENL